jgi:hypothetical protein
MFCYIWLCVLLHMVVCFVCFLFKYVNYVFLLLCLCILNVMYVMFCVFCFIVVFYALFVCKCVLYYCHRVSTQLQLNISYRIKCMKNVRFLFLTVLECCLCLLGCDALSLGTEMPRFWGNITITHSNIYPIPWILRTQMRPKRWYYRASYRKKQWQLMKNVCGKKIFIGVCICIWLKLTNKSMEQSLI